jgi:hypothetical protein
MSSRKRKRVRNDDADNDTSSPPAVVVRTPPVKMEDAPRELFHRGSINDLSDRLGSMSVKELREECATIQLKPKGNRKKLVKRLMYAHTERKKTGIVGKFSISNF